MASGDSSFDEILNGKPTLAELCADVPISTNWYIMGTQLKLDVKKLNEIEDLPKPVPYKVSKMYELWLDTKPQDTRRQILDLLKMEVVGQKKLANEYEEILRQSVNTKDTLNKTSDTLSEKLKLIEELTRYKEVTDKELVEKQEEIKKLTREKEALQSQVIQLHDKTKKTSSGDNLPREEPDTGYRVNDISSDHKTTNITSQRDTGCVEWTSDSVILRSISPTVAECNKVIHQLKRQQHTTWSIKLETLSPKCLLTILTDINEECQVRGLYIENTPFDSHCVTELADVVRNNKGLEDLRFVSSPLLPDTYHLLTTAISNNKTLKSLDLYGDNNITDEDIKYICNLITTNTTLKYLHLKDCRNITKSGMQQMQTALVNNESLSLWINDKYIRL